MKKPFDIPLIEQSWKPLVWQKPEEISGEALRYASYYGIDFGQQRSKLLHSFGYFEAAGHVIAVHAWLPDKARGTVLLAHGYFDHVGLYRHIIEYLLDLDYAVVAYDLPGHGLSSGEQASIDDFYIYQQVLEQCLANKTNGFPTPWHTISQSTGGAIIMEYLLRQEERQPFEKIILLAPLVRPKGWRTAQWLHSAISPFRATIKRAFTPNSNDPAFLHFLQNLDPLQSRLLSARWVGALKRWIPQFEQAGKVAVSPIIIQGDKDGTVDWRYNLGVIEEKFTQPEVHLLKGARHQLANEDWAFREQIRQVLVEHLG